ncbi:MAG: hypothetical protein EB084_17325 [Proteobacteria bacterium]|nr:hypothetical protein [Pseudomonadota bacterium]
MSDSIDTARLALRLLDYPALDPFAASVASVVWASHHAVLTGKTEKIAVPEAFQKPIPVEVNLKNGKDAPMLVIFPGLGSTTITSQVRALKSQALDRGMNYTVMPNPWSKTWLGAVPKHAPGNLPWETQVTRDVLHALQKRHPGFYENVSAVGYSYGSLLGASVVAHDHDAGAGASTVQGSLVAISPPQNLCDSLQALDGLRTQYDPPHNVSGVLASYGAAVTYYGYDRIGESYVAKRQDTDVEKYLADTMASRDHLEQVLEHYHIPTNTSPSQQKQLSGATYAQYIDQVMRADMQATNPGETLEQVAQTYSYTNLLAQASGHGVPVLTLSSADDYILQPANVAAFRALESAPAPDQAARIFEHGGHVGVLFNPHARDQMYAFLKNPPIVPGPTSPASPPPSAPPTPVR